MHFKILSLALVGVVVQSSSVRAGDEPIEGPYIVEPIADGTPPTSSPLPEAPEFIVLNAQTLQIEATESPEMPDLPPVTGTITVTVQMVEDPKLSDPPPPLPALPPDDPAVLARLEEFSELYQGTQLIWVSATVYDHSRTFLQIYPNGKADEVVAAWSNVDFNHFTGFSSYRVTEPDGSIRDYGLLMGVGDNDTAKTREISAQQGQPYVGAEIPESLLDLGINGPAFVVTEGASSNEGMKIIAEMHELYRREGFKMETAFRARQTANAERKAYLLANPPDPKDVTIRFWSREGAQTQTGEEGQ
jgi:hypothetical protein